MNKTFLKIGTLVSSLILGATSVNAAEYIVNLNPVLAEKSDLALVKTLSQIIGAPVSIRSKLGSLENTYVIKTSDDFAKTKGSEYISSALRSTPLVNWVQENLQYKTHATVRPNDTLFNSQSDYLGSTKTGSILLDQAWSISRGSHANVIAILDSGILFDHPDVQGKTLPGYSFIRSSALDKGVGPGPNARDPGNNLTQQEIDTVPSCGETTPFPSDWHGTKVASVAAATSNDGQGMVGVSWNSRILPVRVIGPCGGVLSDILDGLAWAGGLPVKGVPINQNPAKIINLSFGNNSNSCNPTLQDMITRLVQKNIVLVASAGNENGQITDPSVCDGVISVGATTHNGLKSGFSNYGTNATIYAPGGNNNRSEGIQVASNTGTEGPSNTFIVTSDTGTSFSSPIVAGVVANMLAVNPRLTPAQVESILKNTARPFGKSAPLCPAVTSSVKSEGDCSCTKQVCGTGILNAFEAIRSAKGTLPAANPGAVRTTKNQNVLVDGDLSSVTNGRSIASYKWNLVSGNASLSNADSPNVNVVFGNNSTTAVLRLTVMDSVGVSARSDTAVNFITANPVTPPSEDGGTTPQNPTVPSTPGGNGGSGGGGSTSVFALFALAFLMLQTRRHHKLRLASNHMPKQKGKKMFKRFELKHCVLPLALIALSFQGQTVQAQETYLDRTLTLVVDTAVRAAAEKGSQQLIPMTGDKAARNALDIANRMLKQIDENIPTRIVAGIQVPTAIGNREIVFPYRGMEKYSSDQIYFVVAHELAHIKLQHANSRMRLAAGSCGKSSIDRDEYIQILIECMRSNDAKNHEFQIKANQLSREQEHEADLWAVSFLRRNNLPIDYRGIFEKVHVYKSNGNSTHPDSVKRIELIEQFLSSADIGTN